MASGDKQSILDKWLALKQKKQGATHTKTPAARISPHPENVDIPLSYGQQRLWLLQQLHPDKGLYNYAHCYHFHGPLDPERLRDSLTAVAHQHLLLSTAFRQKAEGEVIQFQVGDRQLVCPIVDLSAYSPAERATQLASLYDTVRRHVFDLENDPLLRAWIVRQQPQEHTLILLMHHILGDRSSLLLFNEDLAHHYRSGVLRPPLPKLTYPDFAYWQRQQEIPEKHLAYWLSHLAPPLPYLELPADYRPPAKPSFRGQSLRKPLSIKLSQQLKDFAKRQQATLFMLGMAAFKTLLHRYTAQTDLCIGTPLSNRNHSELARIVGFFNETVVMRTQIDPTLSFTQLLAQVKRHSLAAFSHQQVPFDLLVQRLQAERRADLNPLFQAMFVMNEAPHRYTFGAELEVQEESLDLEVAKFDLTLFLTDTPAGLELTLEYASDRFAAATAARMLDQLEVLLQAIVDMPDISLFQLPCLPPSEQKQLLTAWNNTSCPIPEVNSVLELIDQHVRDRPEQTAAIFGDTRISYAELDRRANALAATLHQLHPSGLTNRFVGLALTPSIDLVVGILGIMRAGAAYLPIDPSYPDSRIAYMLADAELLAVVSQPTVAARLDLQNVPFVLLNELRPEQQAVVRHTVSGQDLAYMIYTSGSTGQPKGVPISHRNLLYSTAARFHYYERQPGTFLLLSSFAFDSSVAGIFWTLSSGGTLVLAPRRIEQDLTALAALVAQHQVTHTLLLPTLYGLLLEFTTAQQLASLELVIVAGEACRSKVVQQHFAQLPTTQLHNEYGPTETSVWSTAHQLSPTDSKASIPIGQPIPNYTNYVLDAYQQLVPIGVAGELYIGGPGLSPGYWKRPELTKERFLDNPFGAGRLYRTGDRVRWRADGRLEFLGRVDNQVKIRGHRIELGEIERQLMRIPAIQEAVVLADEDHGLLAWMTTTTDFEPQAAWQWLRQQLPSYMLPARLVRIDSFPRLPNGKLDRQQLVRLQSPSPENTQPDEPQNELESQLLAIWRQVLKQPGLRPSDDFFRHGGDSLQSIRVIAQAQQANIPLSPNLLFEYPTVRELATYLQSEARAEPTWESVSRLAQGSTQNPPLFCIHSGAAHVFFYRELANYLREDYTVYALQAQGLDKDGQLPSSIEEMAAHYIAEIKRVQAQGPYRLLGTCFSNAVGLEMAHQLQAKGDHIDRLIFVDSGPAHLQSLRTTEGKRTWHRLGQMLKTGDWRGISKKIRNRSIVAARQISQPFKSASAQRLQTTIDNLNDLYARYNWEPYPGDIHFIRSSEFAARPDKDYHLEQWTKLTRGQLHQYIVPGHHLTLFAEPEVQALAAVIHDILRGE